MAGFACKATLARRLAEEHFSRKHYTWCSTELNPIQNGDSSNPLKIYEVLDRAVKLGDVHHPKIKDLRANLMQAVDFQYGETDPDRASVVRDQVHTASLFQLRPELWRIRLEDIPAARVRKPITNAGWDEQVVVDLAEDEFDVIVD